MTKSEEIRNTRKLNNERFELLRTLDEIIDWYIPPTCKVGFEREMMIKYAEHYAKQVLELAADNAEVETEGFYNRNDDEDTRWVVNKDSITNIQLPPHE